MELVSDEGTDRLFTLGSDRDEHSTGEAVHCALYPELVGFVGEQDAIAESTR